MSLQAPACQPSELKCPWCPQHHVKKGQRLEMWLSFIKHCDGTVERDHSVEITISCNGDTQHEEGSRTTLSFISLKSFSYQPILRALCPGTVTCNWWKTYFFWWTVQRQRVYTWSCDFRIWSDYVQFFDRKWSFKTTLGLFQYWCIAFAVLMTVICWWKPSIGQKPKYCTKEEWWDCRVLYANDMFCTFIKQN